MGLTFNCSLLGLDLDFGAKTSSKALSADKHWSLVSSFILQYSNRRVILTPWAPWIEKNRVLNALTLLEKWHNLSTEMNKKLAILQFTRRLKKRHSNFWQLCNQSVNSLALPIEFSTQSLCCPHTTSLGFGLVALGHFPTPTMWGWALGA